MSYLICDECEIYYEIDSDFNVNYLNTCEKCGGDLKYYNNFNDYYNDSSIKKENPTSDYFNKLPEGYFILNNLKIPGRKIKIHHVVIGSTGMFLIHIKNSKGHYIINGNEWLNDKGKMTAKYLGNLSQQIKLNAIELKRFLDSKNLNIDYVLINSIVAFSNRNFTVRKMPRTYNVMHVDGISYFIANSKTKMDLGTVTGSVLLLERYCSGVTRS